MRRFLTVPLLMILLACQNLAAQDALDRIDAYRVPYQEFYLELMIKTFQNDKLDESALFHVYIRGDEQNLVLEKEGRNRDMKILYNEEKMWVQLPSARRPIRITPIQRLMGQASNGDVARVSYKNDYQAVKIGEEKIDGIPCDKLQLEAQKASATYQKIILYVRKEDYQPRKAEFYLLSGKHYKTAFYDAYQNVNGHPILSRMTIVDEIRPGQKTTFEYLDIREKSIPIKYFNKNYLIHVRDL